MFSHVKSSTFYSTYDARELIKNREYKGIDFAYGEMGDEFSLLEIPKEGSELPKGRYETDRSISYGCRIQTTGDEAFNVGDFLDWLAQETVRQIESVEGAVLRQRMKVGRRFYIEYAQDGFNGRIEVDADVTHDQLNLDVEIIEESKD